MKKRIVWWNTGISPPIKAKAGKSKPSGHRTIAKVSQILSIMDSKQVDMICLAEINDDFFESREISKYIADNNYEYKNFYKIDRKIIWDIGIIYNPDAIKITDFAYLGASTSARHRKLAIRIDADIHGCQSRLFLSHFPASHITESQKASLLNDLIMRAIGPEDSKAFTVLMGDYNVELTSQTIINQLARSRSEAIRYNKPYAPLLRNIGEKYPQSSADTIHGTFRGKDFQEFIDFAMVTRGFLQQSQKLNLDDMRCGIWDELFDPNESHKDHLPIYITIQAERKKDGLL